MPRALCWRTSGTAQEAVLRRGPATPPPTSPSRPPSCSTWACAAGAGRPSTIGRGCARSATPAPAAHGRAATGCRRAAARGAAADRGADRAAIPLPRLAGVVRVSGGIPALHPGAKAVVQYRAERGRSGPAGLRRGGAAAPAVWRVPGGGADHRVDCPPSLLSGQNDGVPARHGERPAVGPRGCRCRGTTQRWASGRWCGR